MEVYQEMVYTAIYQNKIGHMTSEKFFGSMSKTDSWIKAAQQAGANDMCLIALVPGNHPVYFFNDLGLDTSENG